MSRRRTIALTIASAIVFAGCALALWQRDQFSRHAPVLPTHATRIRLDEQWSRYTNTRLGFSMDLPNSFYAWNGACVQNEEGYDLTEARVDLVIFEDWSTVFLEPAFGFNLTGERVSVVGDDLTFSYTDCQKVATSRPALASDVKGWSIHVGDVTSDDDLATFVKTYYGEGCSVGAKEASQQDGVVDVEIIGDGKSLDDTTCPLTSVYALKYDQVRGRAATWSLGQEGAFWDAPLSEHNESTQLDTRMLESFTFTD